MSISKADTGVSNFNDYLFEQKEKQEKKSNTPFVDLLWVFGMQCKKGKA